MRVAYGIDLDAEVSIRIRAEQQRGRIRFSPASSGDVPSTAKETHRGRPAIAGALPAGDAVMRRMASPIPSVGKALRVFPALLEDGLPFPLERCVVFVDELVRARPGGVSGLGMAALRERVDARVEAFRAQGVDLTRLDHEARVLWCRSLEEVVPGREDELRVVVYVSATRIALAMGRDRRIEASYGGPSRKGSEAAAGARRALRGWCGHADLSVRMLWAGPGAEDRSIRGGLEAAWADCAAMRHETHEDPESLLARGLAVEALRRPEDGGFLCGSLEPAAVRLSRVRPLKRAAWFALASGLLLAAGAEAWRYRIVGAETAFRKGLNERALHVTGRGAIPLGLEAARAREVAENRRAQAEPLERFFQPSKITVASRIMDAARGREVNIERLELWANDLSVEGRALDWDHPEQIGMVLENSGYALTGMHRAATDGEGRVPFTIEGRLR